jgi:hypothetical protein
MPRIWLHIEIDFPNPVACDVAHRVFRSDKSALGKKSSKGLRDLFDSIRFNTFESVERVGQLRLRCVWTMSEAYEREARWMLEACGAAGGSSVWGHCAVEATDAWLIWTLLKRKAVDVFPRPGELLEEFERLERLPPFEQIAVLRSEEASESRTPIPEQHGSASERPRTERERKLEAIGRMFSPTRYPTRPNRVSKWKTNDATWMAARKASWAALKSRLRRSGGDVVATEAYYLTGEGKVSPTTRLWLEPDLTLQDRAQIVAAMSRGELASARSWLLHLSSAGLRTWSEPEGLLDGLESQLASLVFPPTPLEPVMTRDGPVVGIDNPSVFAQHWWSGICHWLTFAAASDHCVLPGLVEHMWSCLSEDVRDIEYSIAEVAAQCRNFVDPRALPGADTPQARFVREFAPQFKERPLPKTLSKWRDRGWKRGPHAASWRMLSAQPRPFEGYVVRAVQGAGDAFALLEALHAAFVELGFVKARFNASKLKPVSITDQFKPWLLESLGVKPRSLAPAYRYRLDTLGKFSDDGDCVNMDVLLPVPGPNADSSAPLLLLVPRPKLGLDPRDAILFTLNQRMLARVFEDRTRRALLPYEDGQGQKPWELRHKGPFIQTSEQPLKRGRKGLKDDAANDFTVWKGPALAALKR